jgi:hypothetical protein
LNTLATGACVVSFNTEVSKPLVATRQVRLQISAKEGANFVCELLEEPIVGPLPRSITSLKDIKVLLGVRTPPKLNSADSKIKSVHVVEDREVCLDTVTYPH